MIPDCVFDALAELELWSIRVGADPLDTTIAVLTLDIPLGIARLSADGVAAWCRYEVPTLSDLRPTSTGRQVTLRSA